MTTSSSKNKKTHIRDIVLLVSIPLGLLILAAGYTYIPRLLASPKQDFIFAKCSDYTCSDSYEVSSGGVITLVAPKYGPLTSDSSMELYRYDVSTDSTKRLSLDEANSYKVDNTSRSADGYALEYKSGSNGGYFFYSSGEGGWYLKNGALQKPVTLDGGASYSSNREIQFLGWIE